jgi:hypothetical protein
MDVPTTMVKPGEGRSVWLGGMGVVFKVSGADTGGVFAVVDRVCHARNDARCYPANQTAMTKKLSCNVSLTN